MICSQCNSIIRKFIENIVKPVYTEKKKRKKEKKRKIYHCRQIIIKDLIKIIASIKIPNKIFFPNIGL